MSTATSSSDRYAEARAALVEYDAYCASKGVEPKGYAASLTSALRALITPPATEETPEAIAQRIMRPVMDQSIAHAASRMPGLIESAVRAGIQAAWESWEPENAPGIVDTRVMAPMTLWAVNPARSPIFYLDAQVQGILDDRTATNVARRIVGDQPFTVMAIHYDVVRKDG